MWLLKYFDVSLSVACRFHPGCIDMTIEQVKQLDCFVCSEHTSDEALKKPLNAAVTNGKVRLHQLPVKLLHCSYLSS